MKRFIFLILALFLMGCQQTKEEFKNQKIDKRIFCKICGPDNHLYYQLGVNVYVPALDDDGKPIKCEYEK